MMEDREKELLHRRNNEIYALSIQLSIIEDSLKDIKNKIEKMMIDIKDVLNSVKY